MVSTYIALAKCKGNTFIVQEVLPDVFKSEEKDEQVT